MTSLKKYEERLAVLMSTTHAALYERQRRLLRLGLLKAPDKTGPGGGIRATPETVAALLLSILVTDSWSEVDEVVGRFWRIKPNNPGRCPITNATSFGAALTRILSDPELAGEVITVSVRRQQGTGHIGSFKNGEQQQSLFGIWPKKQPEPWTLDVWCILNGQLLKTIADDLTHKGGAGK
jgi:hypothetical protein